MVDHFLPVYPDVDGTAYCKIRSDFVSGNGQVKASVVHTVAGEQLEPGGSLIRIGGGSIRQIYLSGLNSKKCRILFHKEDRDLLHFRCFSIIIWVCLQNHLLSTVPLL